MARANWISYTVKVNGQTMILTAIATNEGPIKNPQVMTLTRLDSINRVTALIRRVKFLFRVVSCDWCVSWFPLYFEITGIQICLRSISKKA